MYVGRREQLQEFEIQHKKQIKSLVYSPPLDFVQCKIPWNKRFLLVELKYKLLKCLPYNVVVKIIDEVGKEEHNQDSLKNHIAHFYLTHYLPLATSKVLVQIE